MLYTYSKFTMTENDATNLSEHVKKVLGNNEKCGEIIKILQKHGVEKVNDLYEFLKEEDVPEIPIIYFRKLVARRRFSTPQSVASDDTADTVPNFSPSTAPQPPSMALVFKNQVPDEIRSDLQLGIPLEPRKRKIAVWHAVKLMKANKMDEIDNAEWMAKKLVLAFPQSLGDPTFGDVNEFGPIKYSGFYCMIQQHLNEESQSAQTKKR